MAWSDTGRKNEAATSGTGNPLDVTLNGTASGSLIVAAVTAWSSGSAPAVSVSDDVNGSYSEAYNRAQGTARAALFYFPNNASGDLTISLSRSPADDACIFVHEFAGGALTSPLSGTPVVNGANSGDASTGGLSPPDDDVLLVASVMYNEADPITENAGGQGFTLSNELEGTGGQPGSLVFKIISGAPGTVDHSWDLGDANAEWAAGIAAFKPASSDPAYGLTVGQFFADDGTGLGEAA